VKLDALEHPKTLDLASRLEASLPATIGHLELLWAFTGKYAPAGDIGRHTDGAIARACHWTGRPELFTLALREAGFIDADPKHRLTIHDWQDHAPRWVKSKLKSMGQTFITGDTPEDASEDTSQGVSEDSKRSEGKRSEVKECAQARAVPGLRVESWDAWLAYRKASGKPIKPASMVAAATAMAALGARQQEAVAHSIANSYQGLYLPKDVPGKPSGRPNGGPTDRDWTDLRHRADKIGFRAPNAGESVQGYQTLVAREEDRIQRGRSSAGPVGVGKLLEGRA
jgi:hypothetical protein